LNRQRLTPSVGRSSWSWLGAAGSRFGFGRQDDSSPRRETKGGECAFEFALQRGVRWGFEFAGFRSMQVVVMPSESPTAPVPMHIPFFRSLLLAGTRIMGTETVLAKTPGDSDVPIKQFCGDDRPALAMLLDQRREQLRRMVELRLDPRTRARLDASDLARGYVPRRCTRAQ
jgi:hypothetical protein